MTLDSNLGLGSSLKTSGLVSYELMLPTSLVSRSRFGSSARGKKKRRQTPSQSSSSEQLDDPTPTADADDHDQDQETFDGYRLQYYINVPTENQLGLSSSRMVHMVADIKGQLGRHIRSRPEIS